MITAQIINKVISSKNLDIISKNNLTADYFPGYEEEFNYIVEHFKKYKNVPDIESFISVFKDFPIIEVTESDNYLLSTLKEEYLYYRSVSIIQDVAKLLQTNSVDAVEMLQSRLPELMMNDNSVGTDLISQADIRYEEFEQRRNSDEPWYITTGFEELDDIVYGWARGGEEFVIIFARTGQGKSWFLVKTLAHALELGFNVGYISPEMSSTKLGYRFDTVNKNFPNSNLMLGRETQGYKEYIEELKSTGKNKFIVATPIEFDKKVTISKLRNFCILNNLDILGIDGITYLSDERGRKGDNKTTTLTNISEDLHSLSLELSIPIIAVVQANREGVKDGDKSTPDLENIRDSDGISHNATKVISLKQGGPGLVMEVKKNRDGPMRGKITYIWDINTGDFTYVPSEDDTVSEDVRERKLKETKDKYNDNEGGHVF